MASILPEYEYDIFISYRQNDNKYDGWVTEFVDNLQKELDATLKNSVSIYFDENPHDGLQDTHVVDESLKKKLKCLIFIPILSQTYCDEKSFAWQHEFLAFNEMANADELGMNISLANGNVASRILPIRIHDIDPSDQQLFEETTGDPLRAIDFVYKEAGVNRSLKPEDLKKENLNNTSYRNQMNKVANALKDLGTGILSQDEEKEVVEMVPNKVAPTTSTAKILTSTSKKGLYVGIAAILLLIIGYWGYTKFSQADDSLIPVSETLVKTIAVLPFANTKPNPETDFLGFALANQIIGDLDYNKNVIVRPASAVRQYDKTVFDTDSVANDLKVNYLLTGTYLLQDGIIRLNIELLEANSEHMIWREKIEVDYNNAFELQDIVAKKVVGGLQAQFSETELSSISKNVSSNPLAYEYYLRSLSYPLSDKGGLLAIEMLSQSLALDSSFAPTYSELGGRYRRLTVFGSGAPIDLNKVENYFKKALTLNTNLISALSGLSNLYTESARTEEAVEISRQMIKLYPNQAESHFSLGYIYRYAGMGRESVKEMEKAIAIDPKNNRFRSIGVSYYSIGEFEKAMKAFEIDKGTPYSISWQGYILYRTGKDEEAIKFFDQILNVQGFWGHYSQQYKAIINGNTELALAILRKTSSSFGGNDAEVWYYMSSEYAYLGDKQAAIQFLQKAVDGGFFDYPYMLKDSFMDSLREDPEFQKILAQAKAKHEAFKEKYF